MSKVRSTFWHGFPAYILENECLCLKVVPDLGAKIVSLLDKNQNREWMVPPMRSVKQTAYGDDFVSQDMSGWDEMMPTIVACDLDGIELPDHGEVWSIPWKQVNTENILSFRVRGVALPYEFTRHISILDERTIQFSYQMENLGNESFPYLWAAHPQFAVQPDTRIVLPESVNRVVNVIDGDLDLGAEGRIIEWPQAETVSGKTRSLNLIRSAEFKSCYKVYMLPDEPVSSAGLLDEETGSELQMSWSSEDMPYLGIWVDEGAYNVIPAVALEPSNGYYDNLVNAVANKRVVTLEPGARKTWKIQIKFGT